MGKSTAMSAMPVGDAVLALDEGFGITAAVADVVAVEPAHNDLGGVLK